MALEWMMRVALTCLVAMALLPQLEASLQSLLLGQAEQAQRETRAALAHATTAMSLATNQSFSRRLPHTEPLPLVRVTPAAYERLTGSPSDPL